MHKSNFFPSLLVEHRGRITASLLVLLLCGYLSGVAFAATPVVLMPVPKPQFFDNAGRPLAFGCLFTYAIGTTTPIPSYTDYTGNTQNTNPVILTAGGFTANGSNGVWIQAGIAYTIVVKAAGGTNCASGSTQYTIDGIGGGTTTQTTIVTYSSTPVFNIQAQNQLFKLTLTGDASSQPITAVGILPPAWIGFEITQDNVGGHSFSWPANSVGGCTIGSTANQTTTQFGLWDGTTLEFTGPCVIGNGPEIDTGTIHVTGDVNASGSVVAAFFKSQCANIASAGTIRLCKTDAINWRNQANSADYGISTDSGDRGVFSFAGGLETTGTIPDIFLGGTTASFPRLKRNATAVNFRLADDSGDAPIGFSTAAASGPITSTSTSYVVRGPVVSDPGASAASTMSGYFKTGFGWCAEDSAGVVYCGSNIGTTTSLRSFHFSSCTTSGTGGGSLCTGTASLPATQADTNYDIVCTLDSGRNADTGSCTQQNGGNPCPLDVSTYEKTTTQIGYQITLDRGVSGPAGGFGTISCVIGHN